MGQVREMVIMCSVIYYFRCPKATICLGIIVAVKTKMTPLCLLLLLSVLVPIKYSNITAVNGVRVIGHCCGYVQNLLYNAASDFWDAY